MMGVFCFLCEKVFSTQSNLNKHRKNVHDLEPLCLSYEKNVWSHQCIDCNESFRTNSQLIKHLKDKHDIDTEVENLQFENFTKFNDWKCEIEKSSRVNYVLKCGKKNNKNESIRFYLCNRSGKPRSLANKIRVTKSQGSCKINKSCTSEIKVYEKNYEVKVTYIKSHYGHEIEVEHIRLNKIDRDMVAAKLMMGASKSRILKDVRKRVGGDDNQIKRIDIMTKHDIDNIKRSYKIETQEGVRHEVDSISIDLWVSECQNLDETQNPVLLYKRQGSHMEGFADNDFCLILMNDFQQKFLLKYGSNIIAMDSTHGLNNYDFELTTIMVVDDTNEGFPAAFMFTNRKDTKVNIIFFEKVRTKVGVINCKTFMTDITGVFYNAWVKVMGAVTHQLYCSWHIDRAWQQNLSKITNKGKRSSVYRTIKYLQQMLDEANFTNHLYIAVKEMLEDSDTREFHVSRCPRYTHHTQIYCSVHAHTE